MGTKIRDAVYADIPEIMVMLENFSEFYGTRIKVFPHPDEAAVIIANLIEEHVFLVADKDGELVGLIAGFSVPHILNPRIRILSECFWWTEEAHRNGLAGGRLLAEFIKRGKNGYDWITLSLVDKLSPIQSEAIEKRDFVKKETAFLMEV